MDTNIYEYGSSLYCDNSFSSEVYWVEFRRRKAEMEQFQMQRAFEEAAKHHPSIGCKFNFNPWANTADFSTPTFGGEEETNKQNQTEQRKDSSSIC